MYRISAVIAAVFCLWIGLVTCEEMTTAPGGRQGGAARGGRRDLMLTGQVRWPNPPPSARAPERRGSVEGWQSGQMQRTVTPSRKRYAGSNPAPSTILLPAGNASQSRRVYWRGQKKRS